MWSNINNLMLSYSDLLQCKYWCGLTAKLLTTSKKTSKNINVHFQQSQRQKSRVEEAEIKGFTTHKDTILQCRFWFKLMNYRNCFFCVHAVILFSFNKYFHLKHILVSYPIQGLLEAVQPVFTGQSVLCEVHSVGDVRGRVLQQGQVHQLPLQPVHLQHVKLDNKEREVCLSCP